MTTTQPTAPMLREARDYASMGFAVFPVQPRGKKPLTAGGFKDASLDADQIQRWWSRWPDANIGLPVVARYIVLDVDSEEALHRLHVEGYRLPSTSTAKTGRGYHFWYSCEGHIVKNGVGILPGVDVRALGGYVVVPPSIHSSGGVYRWDVPLDSSNIAPAPDWLLRKVSPAQGQGDVPTYVPVDVESVLAGVGEGGRDQELFRLACKLRRADVPREWAERLIAEAAARCRPSFPPAEARTKVNCAYSRYQPDAVKARAVDSAPRPFRPLCDLPMSRPLVPALPSELIPDPLRGWLLDITERMQISLEFAAVPVLVALSAVVGRRVGIYPKAEDDWLVVPNLWGGIVARPGKMKSPTMAEALKPMRRLAAQAQEAYRRNRVDQEPKIESLKAKEVALKDLLRQSYKGRKGSRPVEDLEEELKVTHQELQDLSESLIEERYIVNDSTVEKLGELLAKNPCGLLLERDELAGWLRSLDREDRRGDREFFLEAWNGTGSFTYDRIGRGTLHIPALCVSVVGGIQPTKLSRYVSQALDGGYAADGLLQRFQLLVWPEDHGEWQLVDRPPNKKARDRAFRAFATLSQLEGQRSADAEIPGRRFDPQAQSLFYAWLSALEKRLRSAELREQPAFESHLAKYRSLMPSLALLFELVEGGPSDGPVSLVSAQRAAAWCDYLELHARKVYAAEVAPEIGAAHALVGKILKGAIYNGMTVREVYRHGWAGLKTAEQVLNGTRLLEQLGWARLETQETRGRSRQLLRVNPLALERAA